MKKLQLTLFGKLKALEFQHAIYVAKDIYTKSRSTFEEPRIHSMLEFEWDSYIRDTIKDIKGEMWNYCGVGVVYLDGTLLGNTEAFVKWAESEHNFEEYRPLPLYTTLAQEAYAQRYNKEGTKHVFMDFEYDHQPVGKLIIELYHNKLPRTCENFLALCTGSKGESCSTGIILNYKDSFIHRIVPQGWIQGGDIPRGKGDGGESIYGETFADEGYHIKHDARGIVGMANNGSKHTNQSQFYITLERTQWMDQKFVAFGRVVEGSDTLRALETIETTNERPRKELKISECGLYTVSF